MTEQQRIEAQLDILNTVYHVGNEKETYRNVMVEIRKLLVNKDIAPLVEGNGKSIRELNKSAQYDYIRTLEKLVKYDRLLRLKWFFHGFIVCFLLTMAIVYYISTK